MERSSACVIVVKTARFGTCGDSRIWTVSNAVRLIIITALSANVSWSMGKFRRTLLVAPFDGDRPSRSKVIADFFGDTYKILDYFIGYLKRAKTPGFNMVNGDFKNKAG